MKYLFFDTETTGFPPKARLVSIAWQIWDNDKLIEKDDYIVRPEGFIIPDGAANVHGITTEIALEKGVDVKMVMELFNEKLSQIETVVAHNYGFDSVIVNGEFKRLSITSNLTDKKVIDTMLGSTDYVKLPGRYGKYKWPKLEELHRHLFDKDFDDAHSADADVDATVACFFELQKRGII